MVFVGVGPIDMTLVEGTYSCRNHMPLAENQKSEGRCVFIDFADMAGTTISMILGTPNQRRLSLMVDRHPTKNKAIADFVSNRNLGLETKNDYPYERQSRHRGAWNERRYRERGHIRFYFTSILSESCRGYIKPTLINYFLGN